MISTRYDKAGPCIKSDWLSGQFSRISLVTCICMQIQCWAVNLAAKVANAERPHFQWHHISSCLVRSGNIPFFLEEIFQYFFFFLSNTRKEKIIPGD